MALRCLLVDDSSAFLEAAKAALSGDGLQVVGSASTGAEAVALVDELSPDVVLVDIDLGDESGFDVVLLLPNTVPAILISTHLEDEFADMIEASPAIGFVSKSALTVDAVTKLVAASG
jgi:DNA-binding NarL/FixJ family response regulator